MSTKRKHPVKNDEATSSKTQKLENDGSMGLFDHLCEELKEMVFDYLPGKDLINLASCNKALNEYVGNKSRYMKKIVVKINKVEDGWITPRKYENLIFNERMSERELRQISRWLFDDASKRIKNIAFNCILTTDLFGKLLSFTNLEELKIEKFSNFDGGSRTVNMPSLKSLVIMSANNNLKAFVSCNQLKNLKINRFSNDSRDSFKTLIKNQTELERFHLGVADWFFKNTFLFDAPFKLKELSLTYQKLNDNDKKIKENFLLFINKHQETLKTVRSTNIDMLNYFSNFKNLKSVELTKYYGNYAYNMSKLSRFDQVQKLELKCGKPTDCYKPCFRLLNWIAKNFPNLQELSIQHGKMNKTKIFSTLTNLKKLTFINTVMNSELIIPAVEDLTFIKCTFPPMKMPFDFSASSIQKLKIHRCVGIQWVHAYLKHPGKNLATFDASPAGEFEEYADDDKIKKFIRN